MDTAHDLHGAGRERSPADAAVADLVERLAAGLQPVAEQRSVGGDDAVERCRQQDVADAVDRLVRHVGRDLEHDGPVLVLSAAEVEERIEDPQDTFARVAGAVAAGVVAADVHGEVVGILVEAAEELQVVRRGVLGRR